MAKSETINSVDQLKPEAFLQLDLRYCADMVENVCGELLADPPKGIYHIGQVDPVMVDGRSYFYRKGTETLQVEDINTIDSAIYDAAGRSVVPARYMRDKAKFLANTPLLPYRGLHICKDMIEHLINSRLAWRRASGRTVFDVLQRHLNVPEQPVPHHRDETEEQREKRIIARDQLEDDLVVMVDRCIESVQEEVRIFLTNHLWNLYFTRFSGTTLRIERSMDWRIWEWEQKHGDAFRAGKYS